MIPFNDIVAIERDASGTPIGIKGTELVFTHVDHVTGIVRHFAIERMAKAAKDRGMRVWPIKMQEYIWNMVRLNFGIEKHRLDRMTPEICKTIPTIWVELPEKPDDPRSMCTAIMVDGSHRYVYAYGTLGWDRIPGYLFARGEWEEFLVDVPEALSKFDEERIRKQCDGGETFWSGIH